MNTETTTENERYSCDNWDPEVQVKHQGKHSSLRRKVLTRGIIRIKMPCLVEKITSKLRRGLEVRITGADGEDAIRFFPLAGTDCKSMFPKAQAMGDFAKCLGDKRLTVVSGHDRRKLDDDEIGSKIAAQKERYVEEYERTHADRPSVPPDTVVTCPNCGTEFRVGRQLAA